MKSLLSLKNLRPATIALMSLSVVLLVLLATRYVYFVVGDVAPPELHYAIESIVGLMVLVVTAKLKDYENGNPPYDPNKNKK